MKKFFIINYCEDSGSVGGVVGQKDTCNDANQEAERLANEFRAENDIEAEVEVAADSTSGSCITLDYAGCTHHWDVAEVDVEALATDNLAELLALLAKHRFDFRFDTITTAMYHKGQPLTAKIAIIDDTNFDRELSCVFWCPGLGMFVDAIDKEIAEMDAQEVCVWWLNEFKDTEVPYGEA